MRSRAANNRKSIGISTVRKESNEFFTVPIIVEAGEVYEKHNFIVNTLRVIFILILDILPAFVSRKIFTLLGSEQGGARTVSGYASRFQAIEAVYTFPERRARKEINFTDRCWGAMLNNSLALRNRLRLVKRELTEAIKEVSQRKSEVKLMSLGCGSARAVIEVLSRLNGSRSVIRSKFLDIDKEAIRFSKQMASALNVNHTSWHRAYAQSLGRYCNDGFKPDLVEMVGLLDYYSEEEAVSLLSRIRSNMAEDGWLITCNINHNLEQPFLTKGINWPLIYRSPEELTRLLVKAGFLPDNIMIVFEPLKIHGLAIARKSDRPVPLRRKSIRIKESPLHFVFRKYRRGLSNLDKSA